MNTLPFLLVAVVAIGLITGVVIWLVGKLGLGLEVSNFGSALVAGFVAAFASGIAVVLLSLAGIGDGAGLIGGVVYLVVTAATLLLAGRLLPGLTAKGVAGVLVVAVAMGLLYWLGGLLLGRII
jgi:putative membrane protein